MEGIGDRLVEAIRPERYQISFMGFSLEISESIIVMWIVMGILIVMAVIFTRNLKVIPQGKQNFIETVVEFINNFTKSLLGHHWKAFAPYLGTVLLFLVVANTISIFNIFPSGENLYKITGIEMLRDIPHIALRPPTKDLNVTMAFSIMSMIVVIVAGIKVKKLKGWLKDFIEPIPIILPFKILDYFIRPLSLCFRQFGNILGAVVIMELLYLSIPLVLPGILSIYFDLFDGILQAYVFVFLTSLYIAEVIE